MGGSSPETNAELSFNAHDWDNDAGWQNRLSQVYFSKTADEQMATMRLKRKYFKAEIDSNLPLEPIRPDPSAPSRDKAPLFQQTNLKRKLSISANYTCFFLSFFNLLLALGYIFSFSSVKISSMCFRLLLLSSLVSSTLQILVKFGRPRRELSYAQLVLSDDQAHFIIMYFSMLLAYPMFLVVVPICIRSLLFLSLGLNMAILPMFFPEIHRKVAPLLNMLQEKQTFLTEWLSQLDVAVGFILLISLFTSSSQPMIALLYWQYLRVRYMFSSSGKNAIQNARRTLDSYLLHPRSPMFLQNIYRKIQDFAYSTVDPELARSRQDQFQNSKCQIL